METQRPIEKVENEKHYREHNQKDIINFAAEIILAELANFLDFFTLLSWLLVLETTFLLLPEKISITYKCTEDKEDTDQHPGGNGGHPLHIGGVGGDNVEDVDEHKEESDEHGHPAWHNLRGNEETGP